MLFQVGTLVCARGLKSEFHVFVGGSTSGFEIRSLVYAKGVGSDDCKLVYRFFQDLMSSSALIN